MGFIFLATKANDRNLALTVMLYVIIFQVNSFYISDLTFWTQNNHVLGNAFCQAYGKSWK